MRTYSFDDLEPKFKELLIKAKNAMKYSYSPYSDFKVGAAVLTFNDKVYTGTNIENASYSLTICAERVAIFKAVSNGEREIKAIAIISSSDEIISPCGSCRQVIKEFSRNSPEDVVIIMSDREMKKITVAKIEELLPLSFSSEFLEK